jgi:hypothetical protein
MPEAVLSVASYPVDRSRGFAATSYATAAIYMRDVTRVKAKVRQWFPTDERSDVIMQIDPR